MLLDAWCRYYVHSYSGHATRILAEFLNILLGVGRKATKLRTLTHDQLPIQFFEFALDRGDITDICAPLAWLETLHLEMFSSLGLQAPRRACWHGLAKFLKSAVKLKDLRLGFGPWNHCLMYNRDLLYYHNDPESWYLPLWKLLGEHTWANLQTLSLKGMLFCEEGLGQLLYRHAATL